VGGKGKRTEGTREGCEAHTDTVGGKDVLSWLLVGGGGGEVVPVCVGCKGREGGGRRVSRREGGREGRRVCVGCKGRGRGGRRVSRREGGRKGRRVCAEMTCGPGQGQRQRQGGGRTMCVRWGCVVCVCVWAWRRV